MKMHKILIERTVQATGGLTRGADGKLRYPETRDEILIFDPALGALRPMSEAERGARALALVRGQGIAPWQCGDAMAVAPARAPLVRFIPDELVPDGKGGMKQQPTGYRGRDGARCGDVFDRMFDQAQRAHAAKGRKAGAFVAPFSWGQVSIGRDYAALVERCAASGVKCASLEGLRGDGGRSGNREEAMLADFARLRAMHRRIGGGMARPLIRLRAAPHSVGAVKRRAITVRRLVDQVCLADRTLSEVLQAHGWAVSSRVLGDLRAQLCAALDRMQGYRGA